MARINVLKPLTWVAIVHMLAMIKEIRVQFSPRAYVLVSYLLMTTEWWSEKELKLRLNKYKNINVGF